jgi:hypothetical protein
LKRPQTPKDPAVLDRRTSAHLTPWPKPQGERHPSDMLQSPRKRTEARQTVKLTPGSSEPRKAPNRVDSAEVRPSKRNRTARISLHLYQNLQRAETKTKPVRLTSGAPRPVLPRCPAIRSIRSPPPVKRYLGR